MVYSPSICGRLVNGISVVTGNGDDVAPAIIIICVKLVNLYDTLAPLTLNIQKKSESRRHLRQVLPTHDGFAGVVASV